MDPIVIALIVVMSINLLVFPVAYKLQTDKLTDITYSLSFLTLIGFGFWKGEGWEDDHKIIMGIILAAWSLRIGYFLLSRVIMMGRDKRFDEIRTNPKRFFRFFLLQGFASWVISIPFLYYFFYHQTEDNYSILELLGWGIAIVGLIIETVADQQKMNFKSKAGNGSKLYTAGLYKYVRYPNYTGEILFWIGICVASAGVFVGLRWLSLVSPFFIILLLLKVSGIPYLERGRAKQYGDDKGYQSYLKKTKALFPGIY